MSYIRNKPMVGRKPKLYRFVEKEMFKDEVTGEFYQKPVAKDYFIIKPLWCDNNQYNEGHCPSIVDNKHPIHVENFMDDNDIYGTCLACGNPLLFEKERMDTKSDYFKWVITGKSNTKLYEEYKESE